MQKKFDEIRIEDLEVFANHGVFPEENTLGQKFVVSAVLFTDTRMAGKTDDLTEPKIPPEPLEQGGAGGIFCCYSAAIFSGRD